MPKSPLKLVTPHLDSIGVHDGVDTVFLETYQGFDGARADITLDVVQAQMLRNWLNSWLSNHQQRTKK